jgi:hypothetical protein
MTRTDIFYTLPTDVVEFIIRYLSLDEFYNIAWVLIGANNYKKYWKKLQLLTWKNAFVNIPIPYEFIDNTSAYNASTNLLKGPAIIKGQWNNNLLQFIYHYYWKPHININCEDTKDITLKNHIPLMVSTDDIQLDVSDFSYLIHTNPFMYDTLICLIKFMPYKKKRFDRLLKCRELISIHINEIINTNIPIIYSWKQIQSGITRINLGLIQNILLCSTSTVVNLEYKINHIVEIMEEDVSLQSFSWESYNNHPELIIPMIKNVDEQVNLVFSNLSVQNVDKYKTILKHFYPFIYDQILTDSIEQTLSLCKTSFQHSIIANEDNVPINIEVIFYTLASIGKSRLEILLENIPNRYALLTFGDNNRINEMGIIISVSIMKSRLLSPFHNNIMIKICKKYFELWYNRIGLFNSSDQDSIVNCIKMISNLKCFNWNPNDFYIMALNSKNDKLIRYTVDKIPTITKNHYSIASEKDISNNMNEYIMKHYSYHKYSRGLNKTNIILVICILIFILCIAIIKSKNRINKKVYVTKNKQNHSNFT